MAARPDEGVRCSRERAQEGLPPREADQERRRHTKEPRRAWRATVFAAGGERRMEIGDYGRAALTSVARRPSFPPGRTFGRRRAGVCEAERGGLKQLPDHRTSPNRPRRAGASLRDRIHRRVVQKICPLPACGRATSRMNNINKRQKFNKQGAGRGQPSGGRSLRREWSGRGRRPPNGEPQGAPRREGKSLSFPFSGRSGARRRASGQARAGGSDRALSAP